MVDQHINRLSTREKRLGLMLWFRLSRFYNRSIRQTNDFLKDVQLSAAQFDVLAQVGVHKEITQQELSHKLFVTKGNITQLLVKMEKAGLIQRKKEWRTNYVSLTKQGKVLYDEVVPRQEMFQAEQFSGLSEAEQVQLLNLLKKLQKTPEGNG
ncbi:MarR family winged helix-turn-helix transcriptional regulator [Lentibacillus saliphilus]|uniref:MarR family winged helix-turn-helix transcriptional regulator n=1 Tax=Lentibacillus saliphilus TaxID=2737028 RepID=UPI001C30C9CF|nr:MarR family transcriptional regulator [Lentibacillus saliphilus]